MLLLKIFAVVFVFLFLFVAIALAVAVGVQVGVSSFFDKYFLHKKDKEE